ncbi:hypothetical protein [Calothrix sp. PCC 6303]|uniref:hypothetical protein n=1 Tax=Calothrix sp. PCC 6303 TaxID=1170562 RepID=UPI0002A03D5D|nr:hypothetical protein Cal6303_0412 [Calothrix sp. PCC 6303]
MTNFTLLEPTRDRLIELTLRLLGNERLFVVFLSIIGSTISNTNSNNDCNTSNSRDVALLRLYKYLSLALFFQIGINLLWSKIREQLGNDFSNKITFDLIKQITY